MRKKITTEDLILKIVDSGFKGIVLSDDIFKKSEDKNDNKDLKRLIWSVLFSAPLLLNMILELFFGHGKVPILGNGFVMPKNLYKPLEPLTMNTWVEALSEFGLTGFIMLYSFLAFFYRRSKTNFAKSLIISHAIINLNFTQTMPRLDYWIFISAISLISSEFDL